MSSIRRFWLTATLMVITAPILAFGALRSMDDMHNSPISWMPTSFPARMNYTKLVEDFEPNSTVVFSWPGLSWDDPDIEVVAQKLEAASQAEPEPFLLRVITAGRMLKNFSGDDREELDPEVLVEKLRGTVVGLPQLRNGKPFSPSCIILVLTPSGERARQQTLDKILAVTTETTGIARDEVRMVGAPVDATIIDRMSLGSLVWFAPPSLIIVLVLSRICLRSWAFTMIVFLTAGYGQIFSLAGVYFLALPMNAVIIVMPPLVMVLTVSAGVHLVNYYHDEVAEHGAAGASGRAMKNGLLPCTLAAATTAVGLLSLLMSDITPIKVFGALSAVSMLVCVGLLFVLLPGGMEIWPVTKPRPEHSLWERFSPAAALSRWLCRPSGSFGDRFGIRTTPTLVTVLCLLGMVLTGVGLLHLQTSVKVRSLFAADSKIIQDYDWFESQIGPMVPVEVILTFAEDCPIEPLDRLVLVKNMEAKLQESPHVGAVFSGATYFPMPPPPGGLFNTSERTVIESYLESARVELAASNYLNLKDGGEAWRISGRVLQRKDMDYDQQFVQIEDSLEPYLATNLEYLVEARDLQGYQPTSKSLHVSTMYTGIMMVTSEAQKALLNDLFNSFMTALLIITLAMIVLMRSVMAGLLTMLPNILPTTVLFGCTSWLGVPLDIGGVMTASVALGIAVDDTLHFVTWYRRQRKLHQPEQAVTVSLNRCAAAMIQTTLICGLGMSVYMLAEFIPTRRFSAMLVTLLFAAILGDLIMLPAMLLSPLGRFFRPPGAPDVKPNTSKKPGKRHKQKPAVSLPTRMQGDG